MRTLKLTIAYDGTAYSGWQSQTNAVSLQDTFEAVIRKITGETLRVVASGRTDAGVHALGQVVSFPTTTQLPCDVLLRAFNNHLPRDIAVLRVEEAPTGFHAIRHAKRKRYRYLLRDGKIPDVFAQRFAWQVYYNLDVPAMQRALNHILGTHDFIAFQSSGAERESTVRTIFAANIWRGEKLNDERGTVNNARRVGEGEQEAAGQGRAGGPNAELRTVNIERQESREPVANRLEFGACDLEPPGAAGPAPSSLITHHSSLPYQLPSRHITFEICADGFLYNMVRTIVGSLIPVGRGQKPETWLRELVATKTRRIAGQTAPPQGLYLVDVEY